MKGELLFKQGDPPDEVYLVKSGKIEIFVNEGESKKRLNIVTEGEFLGEMAIIDGRPRSASAAALEDSTVIIIDRKSLLKQIEEDPLLGALITTLVRRLREMDRKLSKS
ncbi:MAG: cyclic nucleotide-binding domain-containing protein [candidate division WOR-3 bacterium]